jgi:hypothetical protein
VGVSNAEDRRITAGMLLAADPEAWGGLVHGLPVDRSRLKRDVLERIGEKLEGPPLRLTDELALAVLTTSPNGGEPDPQSSVTDDTTAEPHSWRPLDLRAVGLEPAPRPSIGELVYAGLRHVFHGEPEAVKTWAAAVLGVEEVLAGNHIVYIDAENGAREMRERFLALGLSEDDFDRIAYIEPGEPLTKDAAVLADVERMLGELRPTLVILDSFDALLELHGLDPNSTADVSRFYRTVVDPLRATGAAIVLLDHVSKDRQTRGRWAIGSQRKIGLAEVALGFELVHPFGRGKTGLTRVVTHKDRRGWLPRPRAAELELRSDAETGAVDWTWRPASTEATGGVGFRPTRLMEKVSRFVEAHVAEEKVTRSAVEEAVEGKAQYVRAAMDCLVEEGFLEETPGPRGARHLTSVRPFREGIDDGD